MQPKISDTVSGSDEEQKFKSHGHVGHAPDQTIRGHLTGQET